MNAINFSIKNGVYPLLGNMGEYVSAQQMRALLNFLSSRWKEGIPTTYYNLESSFGWSSAELVINRQELIFACRYFFLSGALDTEFWNQLCKRGEGPIEAELIITDNEW